MAAKKKAAKKKATGTGIKRTHVEVDGKVYQSVYAAFVGLKLPIGSHAGFRAEVRAKGKGTFEVEGGKKYNFKATEKDVTEAVDLANVPAKTAKKKAAKPKVAAKKKAAKGKKASAPVAAVAPA